jgi:glycolate oxidase iron-sulfur subunit
MQTFLNQELKNTPEGREADEILRSCVHCGFCNATCPTFGLLGDERDGPRGRIYLIKDMLEQGTATRETQLHLDRCLTCLACETTCPSGVQYERLLEIGRSMADSHVRRPTVERIKREFILRTVPEPGRFRWLLSLAHRLRPLLPSRLKKSIPASLPVRAPWPDSEQSRKVLLLEGCAQSVSAPQINQATARVLQRLGIQALPASGCCGALSHHLSKEEQTLATARRNIDGWWEEIESGAEALLLTASGCVSSVTGYGRLLRDDPEYAEKADKLASMAQDISAFLEKEDLEKLTPRQDEEPLVAFHSPCTLQHGLKRAGSVESLLARLGFNLTIVPDAHICCGSAGSYSILQPELSRQLLAAKLDNLQKDHPTVIATANIGCLMHLQSGTERPVKHWIELLS